MGEFSFTKFVSAELCGYLDFVLANGAVAYRSNHTHTTVHNTFVHKEPKAQSYRLVNHADGFLKRYASQVDCKWLGKLVHHKWA